MVDLIAMAVTDIVAGLSGSRPFFLLALVHVALFFISSPSAGFRLY